MHQNLTHQRTIIRNMKKNLAQLFQADTAAIPSGIEERIYARIGECAAKTEHREKMFWGIFFIGALGSFIGSGVYAVSEFSKSNFGSYFSIIFSDTGTLALFWRELGLSLVESLPIFGIVLFLGSVSLALWSLHKFMKKTGGLLINTSAHVA